MSDELAEAAFLAGVPMWTDELAKAVRDKKPEQAEKLALRLHQGFGLVAACQAARQKEAA